MILADFGAEVIKVSPQDGDTFQELPSYPMWMRGKKEIRVNLSNDSDLDALRALIVETGDAVVTSLKLGTAQQLLLDADSLQDQRPDLVYGHVSGFGIKGPYKDYPGYEGVVAAKSGRMLNFAGVANRDGPNYSALQVGVHATAQSIAAAVLAALDAKERTAQGLSFNTSLLRGMIPYEMGVISMRQLQDKGILPQPQVARDRTKSMPTLNYHPVQTKDGHWLQLGNLLPHLLTNFLKSAGFDEVFEDPKYKGDPMRWDPEVREEFRDRMLAHMQTRTLAEWTDHFVKDGGVVSHPYQSTQDALNDPDIVANGHVVEVESGKQIGLLANLTATPGKAGGCHTQTSISNLQGRLRSSTSSGLSPVKKPLEGVTVVESATIIAAPLGAATLADMGARVIKLEPLGGDPFRSMMSSLGASKCNTGKESICLDLKSLEGQKIAQELAQKADIWIHNYRVGVPEKLGIGYEDLSKVNPQLIYISANGYGPNGPGAKRPSTHPIPGAALGGVVWQIGGLPEPSEEADVESLRETARKLLRANEVNPDPNTSMVVATTACLGLHARRASGQGQKIFIDMFGANAYANWDDFLSYEGKNNRLPMDSDGYGLGPLYRLYACQNGWIFLGVVSEKEKDALSSALEISLKSNGSLQEELASKFKENDAPYWEAKLTARGIGCVVADEAAPPDWFLTDPHVREEGLLVPAQHPDWGDYLRLGPMVEFDEQASYPGTEAAGGSTRELLLELNYSSEQIEHLLTEEVVVAAGT